jgi:aminopeptidase N
MYHPVEADADHFHRLVQLEGGWSVGAEIDEREPASEYRVVHHALRVQLRPATHSLKATDRMTVRRLAGAQGLMLARMSEDLDVSQVRVDGAATPFARAGGLLAVVMPPGPPGMLRVDLEYHGAIHHPEMDDIDPKVSFLFSYWYPNIARLPTTADIVVTAPAAWSAIAEGECRGRTPAGSEARTVWRQTHPVCWLELAAGPYQRTSRTLGSKTLNAYLLRPDPHRAQVALDTLASALPVFSRSICTYPWSHYDVVEYPMTVGALEGYSMATMKPEMIRGALPHELAHSWWGGIVPNTYTVDMWNEAFATYSERLLKEAIRPPSAPGGHPGDDRRRALRVPPRLPIIGAVDALDEPEAVVGYQKGEAVLYMFRRTMGDATFHRVLTRFAGDMAGQAATWRDFQRTAEKVTRRDLAWFFDPWLTRPDIPQLRWGPARQEGNSLDAEIEMTTPAYRLRLPVAIDTADGKRRIETVEVTGPSTRVHETLATRAVRLVLDPDADFLLAPADENRRSPWMLELSQAPVARPGPAPGNAEAFSVSGSLREGAKGRKREGKTGTKAGSGQP